MKVASLVFLVTLFVIFSACATKSDMGGKLPVLAKLEASFRIVDISTGKSLSKASIGQPVKLVLELKNMGDETIVLKFDDGQQYDFEIRDTENHLVWKASHGDLFIQALTTLTLEPKAWIKFTPEWDQKDDDGKQVPAGVYTVSGIIPTVGPPFPAIGTQTLTVKPKKSAD